MWHGQVSAFADRYRILRYDSRGHGKSDAPPGEYSIERLGECGVSTFVEVGPGKVLRALIRRIIPSVKVFNVGNREQVEAYA